MTSEAASAWTHAEKLHVVRAYRSGSLHPACPRDGEEIDVDVSSYFGAANEIKICFECPKCRGRAEWYKKRDAIE
jgi:hypothetical protein